jgi:hypothetical protein
MLESLTKSTEPVREVMAWVDKCCERLIGSSRAGHGGAEERSTMNSRAVLIRLGYVTSQVMRDLVRCQTPTPLHFSDRGVSGPFAVTLPLELSRL